MSQHENLSEVPTIRNWFLGGLALTFVVWALSGYAIYYIWPDPTDHGTFGDLFGAINALFSGWAFLGALATIYLQNKELEEQRKEIREARIAQQESAIALERQASTAAFQTEVQALNTIIDAYNRKIERLSPMRTVEDHDNIGKMEDCRDQYEVMLENLIRARLDAIRAPK